MNGDLRLDTVMKSIDVLGRLAFGGQCVAAMAMLAAPLVFITATIVPFLIKDDNSTTAIIVWLGGWLLAVGVEAAGIAFGVFCWRWSGDWITEWPGYAVAFAFAAVANIGLGYMLTSTPIPVYASFTIAIAAIFLAGFLVAGHLGGLGVLSDQRELRQREIARRR
jgi:hypothetical protein